MRGLVAGVAAALLACVAHAAAAERQHGSWLVDPGGPDGTIAATINDSGQLLGQLCLHSSGQCHWIVAMKVACVPGNRYAVLANSDKVSASLQVMCTDEIGDGLYRYAFTDFDAIDNLVRRSNRVGFAFPMKQDQFRVLRFDLNGSNRAIAEMRAAFIASRPSPGRYRNALDRMM